MSYVRVVVLVCDRCETEIESNPSMTLQQVRGWAREDGWSVGRLRNDTQPTKYQGTVDICDQCLKREEKNGFTKPARPNFGRKGKRSKGSAA